MVRINGPWDGPVRVIECSPNSFAFQTLEGHLEAGQIAFSFSTLGKDEYKLTVESMARCRDQLINFFYDTIPVIKFMQTTMWKKFCRKFVTDILPNAQGMSEVTVSTERFSETDGRWQTQ